MRHDSFVNQLVFSPDDNYLVSAGDDRAVYVWNITQKNSAISSQPFNKYNKVYNNSVTAVVFSPDGKTLASAGYDNLVRLWDWEAGNLSPRKDGILTGHTGYVTSLTFTAEGLLASTGFDGQVIVWDIKSGQQIGPAMKVHTKAVNQVVSGSFTSDGVEHPYLVSVSNDLSAIQWDLFTREPLSPYADYADPKNQSIVAAPGDWATRACDAAKRNLTTAEWSQYLSVPFKKTCPAYP
jgi:WD40 repeat protein